MSTETLLLALVACYVGIIVLWHLTVSDSLYALAVLRARVRHRWWPRLRDGLVLAFDRLRHGWWPGSRDRLVLAFDRVRHGWWPRSRDGLVLAFERVRHGWWPRSRDRLVLAFDWVRDGLVLAFDRVRHGWWPRSRDGLVLAFDRVRHGWWPRSRDGLVLAFDRVRHGWWPRSRDRLVLASDRSCAAAVLAVRAWSRRRRHLAGALAGAAIVGLAVVAVVGTQASGSKGKVSPTAALGPHSANPARLRPSRPLAQPVAAAGSHTRRSTQVTGQTPGPRVRRAREQPTKVVSLVRVSARVSTPATSSRQVASTGNNPAPLPAPAPSSGPSPLAAP